MRLWEEEDKFCGRGVALFGDCIVVVNMKVVQGDCWHRERTRCSAS